MSRWNARYPPLNGPLSQTFSRTSVNLPLTGPSEAAWGVLAGGDEQAARGLLTAFRGGELALELLEELLVRFGGRYRLGNYAVPLWQLVDDPLRRAEVNFV
ncbi:hypothetical protein AB0D12_35470 [Streptomyces sp. NPDC048479]|uniref:hypothetical protein n=1 Tax=Streptomyces sp. NPDC048479 TaxID=3154725 RepID=UPI003433AEE6